MPLKGRILSGKEGDEIAVTNQQFLNAVLENFPLDFVNNIESTAELSGSRSGSLRQTSEPFI